jgi:MOSC domain-containing protein YiiM
MFDVIPGWLVVLVLGTVAAFLLDRLALWMEGRGWIYWRRTKTHTGASLGGAFLEVQALIDPSTRHAIEERKQTREERADSGDPPNPGGSEEAAVALKTGWTVAVSRDGGHEMGKLNRESIRLLEGLGVEGDAHAGRRVKHLARVRRDPHQPNLRQVHLIHAELFDELQESGIEVAPGEMGENITTRGVDLLNLSTGSRLRIGKTAIVEITGLRDPCSQLESIQPGLMAATLDRDESGRLVRKAGVMGVVIASGDVSPGDPVRVELPPAPRRPLEPV